MLKTEKKRRIEKKMWVLFAHIALNWLQSVKARWRIVGSTNQNHFCLTSLNHAAPYCTEARIISRPYTFGSGILRESSRFPLAPTLAPPLTFQMGKRKTQQQRNRLIRDEERKWIGDTHQKGKKKRKKRGRRRKYKTERNTKPRCL